MNEKRDGSFVSCVRADVVHHPLDPVIVAGPWIVAGVLAFRGVRALSRLGNTRASL